MYITSKKVLKLIAHKSQFISVDTMMTNFGDNRLTIYYFLGGSGGVCRCNSGKKAAAKLKFLTVSPIHSE